MTYRAATAMKRFERIARTFAVMACCLASVCSAQSPIEILDQAREKLLHFTRSLPKYTCTETIDREYFLPPPVKGRLLTNTAVLACPASLPGSLPASPAYLDRVRLEVTVAEGREIHAWPGANEFDTRRIDEIIDGPTSTGEFGTYLIEIFDNPGSHFTYIGETTVNGRKLLEYAYRTDVEGSHYRVSGSRIRTAHSGSFEIDRDTLELVRLAIETNALPPEIGMCRTSTKVEYHSVPIGDGGLILPIQSELQVLEPGPRISRARTTFSACHEYAARSSIHFDDEDPAVAAARKSQLVSTTTPSGIHFTLRTIAPIDLSVAAAGDRISARVTETSNPKILPKGAIVSGRITRLRHFMAGRHVFQIAIALDTAIAADVSMRLGAIPDRHRKGPGLPINGMKSRGTYLAFPPLGSTPQEAFTTFPGDTKIVKPGFESSWITAVP